MQITSAGTQPQTYVLNAEPINGSTVNDNTIKETPKYTTSINESAGEYIKLDMDLTEFTKIDPVQEQTNRDLNKYLLKVMDEDTSDQKPWNGFHNMVMNVSEPGKKENFTAFQAELHFNRAFAFEDFCKNYYVNHSRENDMFFELNSMDYSYNNVTYTHNKDVSSNNRTLRRWEVDYTDIGERLDGFGTISKEDSQKKWFEQLKNMYNLTDDFVKSDKFEEFLQEYINKTKEILDAAHANDQTFDQYLGNGLDEFLINDISKNARSKSEIIEYYDSISSDLRGLIKHYEDTPNMSLGKGIIEDMHKSINLYDRMSKDLKEMWGFGDFDVYS